MSFILDALKKSENDRQRQSGPAFFEVRVAPPRSRFPSWAIALVALLVVNLGVIGWFMLRRPAAAATPPMEAPAVDPAVVGAPSVQSAPPPVAQTPPPSVSNAPGVVGQPYPQQQQGYPPQAYSQQQQGYPQQQQQGLPPQGYPQQQPMQVPQQQGQYPAPTLGQNVPAYGGQQEQGVQPDTRFDNAGGNPDDYAPAAEPTGQSLSGRVRRGLESGLMTYEEAATKNTIPPLHMDLHVYAPDPRNRFVLVNGKRLYETQSLPEGVKVERITTDGAVLSFRGVQFMMERD
jgi:general secretion pathway protein B